MVGKKIVGKRMLSRNLNEALRPIRDRRSQLVEQPDFVWDVLATGRDRARQRAGAVMEKVRSAMKTDYRKNKKG